jgi:hypothetical protein
LFLKPEPRDSTIWHFISIIKICSRSFAMLILWFVRYTAWYSCLWSDVALQLPVPETWLIHAIFFQCT